MMGLRRIAQDAAEAGRLVARGLAACRNGDKETCNDALRHALTKLDQQVVGDRGLFRADEAEREELERYLREQGERR